MISSKVLLKIYIFVFVRQFKLAVGVEFFTNEHIIKEKSTVIHNPQSIYEQPTLQDYIQCHADLDHCIQICRTTLDPQSCGAECPVCPMLLSHDIVVQGINDTDYLLLSQSINVTKLRNEIPKVIEATTRQKNNDHVHRNSSSTPGGRFGLGYNKNGSCCIVVRSRKRCQVSRFSAVTSCRHKRMRICGERCKARIMYAKPMTNCNDEKRINCSTHIEYVPSNSRRKSLCQYQLNWPFISCGGKTTSELCLQCLRLPYGYILDRGIPPYCVSCLQGFVPSNGQERINLTLGKKLNTNSLEKDWSVTTKKCRSNDGDTFECLEDLNKPKNELQYYNVEAGVENISYGTQNIKDNYRGMKRRRRHSHPAFYRSAYSRRNKSRL